ncbi:MAG: hypothetical protein LBL00_07575 [Endomicrobium sp.]|jgi:tetratricopeptide (TPR) repeat protein|nr:hypothetical protein [Endomicrobium sp.]
MEEKIISENKMKKSQVFLLIGLMFITVFVFYPALSANFVALDDGAMVAENRKIRSLSPSNFKALLLEPHYKLYHPIVNLSYAVEYHFFGADPYIYHADNLILHLFSTLFVFFIFFRLTKKNYALSFITAFVFACHPMHVEPVAWITGRKDTLYAFFFLASWLAYLKAYSYQGKKYVCFIAISLVLFLFSCLSKSMAVTLPAVLILCDWFTGEKFDKKSLLKYLPFIAVAAAFSLITYLMYYTQGQKSDFTLYTLFVNFVSAHFNALFYIVKFMIPVKLSAVYPHFYNVKLNPPDYILYSPALLYGIAVLVLYSLKKTKNIFFGSALFAIVMLPVINILPTGVSPVADRYAYISFIGFAYVLASGIMFLYVNIRKKYIKILFSAAVSAAMIIMCFTAHTRAEKWHDSGTLFEDMVKNYPGEMSKAYSLRAIGYKEKGMEKKAEKDLEMALYLDLRNTEAACVLATIRIGQKKYNEALRLYSLLYYDDYNIEVVYMYSSRIYYEKQHKDKAFEIIKDGIKRFPNIYYFYNTLSIFYAYEKEYDKAVESLQKSKRLNPKYGETYKDIAQLYDILGKFTLVEKEYKEGILNCPDSRNLLYGLGEFYFNFKDLGNASVIFMKTVKKFPGDFESYLYLGNIESINGNFKKALYYYTLAVLIKNDYAQAYFARAQVHLEMNNYLKSAQDAKYAKSLGFNINQDYEKELKQKSGISISESK